MDFETCIASHSSVLMEGALGERLKREYGLTINGSVAMADLIYSQQGRLALDTLWRGYMGIAENTIYRSWLPLRPDGLISSKLFRPDMMRLLLRIMSGFSVR